jgi:hypothetical protein
MPQRFSWDPDRPVSRRLAHSYSALLHGLVHGAESDYPYRPFVLAWKPEWPIDEESLRRELKVSRRMKMWIDTMDEFFTQLQSPDASGEIEIFAYVALEKIMRVTLTDLTSVDIALGIGGFGRNLYFGRAPDGNLAGVQSNNYT